MNSIKKLLFFIICASFYSNITAWKLGGGNSSIITHPAFTYSFFSNLKKNIDELLKTTKSKTTIADDESSKLMDFGTKIETAYSDLFTKVAKQGSTNKNVEPFSLLSYKTQQQIMDELAQAAPLIKTELEKTVLKTTDIKNKINSMSSKTTTFTTKSKEAQNNITALNNITLQDPINQLNTINQFYEKLAVWGNFETITLPGKNLLNNFTPDQLKNLLNQKNTALQLLNKKLKGISTKDVNIKTAISNLTTSITEKINKTNKALESLIS